MFSSRLAHALWILPVLLCDASIAKAEDLVQVDLGCELKCRSFQRVQKMTKSTKYIDEPISIQGRWNDNLFVVSVHNYLTAADFCQAARKYLAAKHFGKDLTIDHIDFDDCKTRALVFDRLGWYNYEIQADIELHEDI